MLLDLCRRAGTCRAPNACGLDGGTLSRFQASAIENGLAVAMANHAAGYRCCNGMSVAFDHLGRPLVADGHGGHEEQVRPLSLGCCVHLT